MTNYRRLGGGAERYSSRTLLTTAIGRPRPVDRLAAVGPVTASFSPRMLTALTFSGISMTTGLAADGRQGLDAGDASADLHAIEEVVRHSRNSVCTMARDNSFLSIVNTPIVAVARV